MAYGPYDDDVEVRIPRHDKAGQQISMEPSALAINKPQPTSFYHSSLSPPGVYDWYFFTVELQTALAAGVPFVRAISLVATGSHKRSIRRAGNIILEQLKRSSGGVAIMQATEIPPLIRHMMVVGLRGGDVADVLRQTADHYGWLLNIRGQILRIITYPAMLVILGSGIMILRDTAIATLTGSMTTGEAAVKYTLKYGLPVLTGAVGGVIAAWLIYLPGIRSIYDRVILTAPVVGKTIRQYSQAVFFRTLATLVEAGMPITDGWTLAARVMPNEYLGKRLEPGLRFLRDGESIEEALRQTHVMDTESRAMAAIGEVAGSVPAALRKYADYRKTELESRVKMIISLLGLPCIVIVALGYFHSPIWLAILVFVLVFIRRAI